MKEKKYLICFFIGILLLILFLLGKLFMLALFPIFLVLWSLSSMFENWSQKIKLSTFQKFLIIGIITGLITEALAILNNLGLAPEKKGLFHPDPFLNILVSFGYYIPLFLALHFLLKRYSFKTSEVFLLGGLFGLIVEQGAVILMSLNPLAWAYVLLVHGSMVAIPFALLKNEFKELGKKATSNFKYVLGFFLQFAAPIATALWTAVLKLLNII